MADDSVYVLTLNATGAVIDFKVDAQNYKPKSTTCDPAKYVPPPGGPGYVAPEDEAGQQVEAAARETKVV